MEKYDNVVILPEAQYFKAILIKVDTFESEIIDERHFKTLPEAEQYINEYKTKTIGIIVKYKGHLE